ncbi:hypothetical protein AMECASPLE_036336 [Ameca splendens]|uniref:Uncharacterized protein n=1 Tax=Ameca splendens TaxID=208324 RepID=A0ABV0YJ29_9TELE
MPCTDKLAVTSSGHSGYYYIGLDKTTITTFHACISSCCYLTGLQRGWCLSPAVNGQETGCTLCRSTAITYTHRAIPHSRTYTFTAKGNLD